MKRVKTVNKNVISTEVPKVEHKHNWISFVKQYAKENNMTYRQALKNKECKEAYLKSKS